MRIISDAVAPCGTQSDEMGEIAQQGNVVNALPFYFMDYQVMECRYNYSPDDADILFATNDWREAIEAAKEFGDGTVVIKVDKGRKKQRIFTTAYNSDLGIKE